ncbi:MAG: saccharopine dehydrogenase NADP-binding domain-containing protein [Acidobacteriaceae bacterium]
MKALLLGGTGSFGKSAAALFAGESLITKIGIASRNLENAQQAANELGSKGHAVCVDIQDLTKLSTIASDYDIIVNAAGPTSEVQVPALFAATERWMLETKSPQLSSGHTTLHHIALNIALDDFEAEKRRLEGLGVKVRATEHAWLHLRSQYFTDPEGNLLEFVAYDERVR